MPNHVYETFLVIHDWIQLLNELLGHFCSLLHASRCVRSSESPLALRKTIFVAAKIAAVRCSLAHCSFRFDAAADPVIKQK